MTPEMQKELLSRLDVLSQKLGVTVDHLWTVLIRQQYIQGFTELAWAIIGITMFAYGLKCFFRSPICHEYETVDSGGYTRTDYAAESKAAGMAVVFGILGAIGLVIAIICITDVPGLLFNPEYGALTTIMQAIGK